MKRLIERYKQWEIERMLKKITKWKSDSNIIIHAKRELPGFDPNADDMDKLMAKQLIQMVSVFSHHNHSGFSASFATSLLNGILKFEPLSPLTGEESEWELVTYPSPDKKGETLYQNKRCSRVFKRVDKNNKINCYDINGKVFIDTDG